MTSAEVYEEYVNDFNSHFAVASKPARMGLVVERIQSEGVTKEERIIKMCRYATFEIVIFYIYYG